MGELSVLDRTGDTRLQWNPSNKTEVDAAKKRFDELRKKGYAAFRTTVKGNKGEQIDEFDPMDERVILVPAMVGG